MADQPASPNKAREQIADFAEQANQPRTGIAAELLDFLLHNKKWWLTPIILILLLMGLLVALAGTPAGALIYTLF